jgi:hypothetical protein
LVANPNGGLLEIVGLIWDLISVVALVWNFQDFVGLGQICGCWSLDLFPPVMVNDFQKWVKFWEEIWWIAMAFVKYEFRVLFVNIGTFVMMMGWLV